MTAPPLKAARGRGGPHGPTCAATPPRPARRSRLRAGRGGALAVLCLLAALAPPRAEAQDAPAPDTLVVVTLNIWHDRGDWPARLDLIERDLRALRPDVVLLQEVLQNEGLPNQARTIADRLGLAHVHFVSVDSAGAAKRYGNAILSAHAFAETAERRLPPLDAYRTAAYARIDVGGRPVRLYTTHLHHPATADGRGARAMEIAHLLDFVAATGGDAPLVLGGDFNAEPDAPEMRMLGGLRDLGGAGATWGPATGAAPRRIDYLFDAADARLVPVAAGVALDRPAPSGPGAGRYPSDHSAVFARFLLP